MQYPDLDQNRLDEIEKNYNVKCLQPIPFGPTDLVNWDCNSKHHQWIASPIELQIDGGCFQCTPGDIKISGNGSFVQSMSKTLSDMVNDFDKKIFKPDYMYLPDAALHITLASFFFTAVRTEFVLNAISEAHPSLGLINLSNNEKFSTVELVNRMFKLGSNNLSKFTIPKLPTADAVKKYTDLKDKVELYVIARNKIAHGYSKYPLSNAGNYNAKIADLIKSFGQNGLGDVYSISSKFTDISEKLLDDSTVGISLGNRILPDLFFRC